MIKCKQVRPENFEEYQKLGYTFGNLKKGGGKNEKISKNKDSV